jgi:DNA-binding beta-propeller fold protein YncE
MALDPSGKFAYVVNEGCGGATFGNVSMYSIDVTTGLLTSIGPPVNSNDEGGQSVAVDSFGKFVYVTNSGEGDTPGSISAYAINGTTGALTFTGMTSGACPGLCAPWSVAVHPSGRFAYVADEGGFSPTGISVFSIDSTTGALTSTGIVSAAAQAISVAVDPFGKFAYVANGLDGSGEGVISIYTISGATGDLSSIGTIAAGLSPASIAVDPHGKFAYVANWGSNNISMYTIDATTGNLALIGTTAAGLSPSSIAIHPSGKFAYVTNTFSNDISIYSIDSTSGVLTLIANTGT